MQLYSFILDLRISHPALDPEAVTKTLGIKPKRAWRAGEPRKTPKGTALAGTQHVGYWSANPFDYGWRVSTDALVEDDLEELVRFLEPHQAFLQDLCKEGQVQIWVSSSSLRNYACELSPAMLARVASLGASFIHDVYQGE